MPRMTRNPNDQERADRYGADFLDVLARGLKVLGAFNASHREMTLSEIAALVDLPRASVRRALLTFEKLGFVSADGRRFKLTPRVLTLASAYLGSNIVPAVMQPIVERVAAAVDESCSAAVLDGDDVVFVARATRMRIISVGLEVGYRLPAYGTSVGRVLLSAWSDDDLDAYLVRVRPQQATEHSLVDKAALHAAIIAVRGSGYALVDEEVERGFRSIAVPVMRLDGRIACAIHIGVHVERVDAARMLRDFLPVLREAAGEATSMLV